MIYLFVLLFFLLFSFSILIVIVSSFIGFLLTRVPFVRTSAKDVAVVVEQIGISSDDILYDLGSGDGMVIFLVEKLSGAKTTGFELTWWTHALAQLRKIITGSKAVFINRNFFHQSWSEATVIYGYLYPPLMGRVETKFLEDCKPGTKAIIRDFPFPTLKEVQIIRTGNQSLQPQFHDTKWNRFVLLLKSLWPHKNRVGHEFYIYVK